MTLLGQFELERDGVSVADRLGRQDRIALAVLVLAAGRRASRETIAEALWPNELPRTWATGLRGVIARIRRGLDALGLAGMETLLSEDGGYRLVIPETMVVDVSATNSAAERAAGSLAAGDLDQARTEAGNALDHPLDQFMVGYEGDWAEAARRWLLDVRRRALETVIQLEEQAENPMAAVAAAQTLLLSEPLDEAVHRSLIRNLAEAGNRAKALRAYEHCRVQLRDELGVSPSSETRALYERLLDDRPGADGSMPRPGLPPRLRVSSDRTFVGRAREERVLGEAFERARGGAAGILLIGGEPGVGKTALVARFGAEVVSQGATVLYGRCNEGIGIPYEPFVEAVDEGLGAGVGKLLSAMDPARAAMLGQLFPGAGPLDSAGRPSVSTPEVEQHLTLSGFRLALEMLAGSGPVVLVLDDLHWADPATMLQLEHLANQAVGSLLVVATYRDAGVANGGLLSDTMARLRREPEVRSMTLDGLSADELAAWAASETGREFVTSSGGFIDSLHRGTAGNPFFVSEVLRQLVDHDDVLRDAAPETRDPALPMPSSVRDVVYERVDTLGGDCPAILAVAAVIGADFDVDALVGACDSSEEEVLDALEIAERNSLVVEAGPNRHEFVHALVPSALSSRVGAARRSRIHGRVAHELEHQPDARLRAGEIAYHWVEAGNQAAAPAATWCERAGEQALSASAPGVAIDWFTQAQERLDHTVEPDRRQQCRLSVLLGTAERQAGDRRYRDTLLAAAREAVVLDEPELVARAALVSYRGLVATVGEVDHQQVSLLTDALSASEGVGDAQRAVLLAMLAVELGYSGTLDERVDLTDQAMELAERAGDDATLVHVLSLRAEAIQSPQTLEQRLQETGDFTERALGLEDPALRFDFARERAIIAVQAADMTEAQQCVAVLQALADSVDPARQWLLRCAEAAMALVRGDLASAETAIDHALEFADSTDQPDAEVFGGALIANLTWQRQGFGDLQPVLVELADEHPGVPGFAAAAAHALLDADDLAGARDLLRRQRLAELPVDVSWLMTMILWADVIAATGDIESAGEAYELLSPWAGQFVYNGLIPGGAVAHALGVLAVTLDRTAAADVHFPEALETERSVSARFFEARSCLAWGRWLITSTDADRARRGHELLAQAGQLAHGRFSQVERIAAEPPGPE